MGSRICFMVLLLAKRQYDLIFRYIAVTFLQNNKTENPRRFKIPSWRSLEAIRRVLFLKELVIFYTTTLKSALCPTIRKKQIRSS